MKAKFLTAALLSVVVITTVAYETGHRRGYTEGHKEGTSEGYRIGTGSVEEVGVVAVTEEEIAQAEAGEQTVDSTADVVFTLKGWPPQPPGALIMDWGSGIGKEHHFDEEAIGTFLRGECVVVLFGDKEFYLNRPCMERQGEGIQ